MLRIMTADEPASTTITVDGRLSGESIEPVQACCIQALANGKPVKLYLRDVSAIDERGRAMLRHLAEEGVDVTAKGIYSSYIVDEIQSASLSKRRSR
jgi:hypothetical protein